MLVAPQKSLLIKKILSIMCATAIATTTSMSAAYRRALPIFGSAAVRTLSAYCTNVPNQQSLYYGRSQNNKSSGRKRLILIGAGGKKGMEYYNLLKDHVNFVGFVQPNPRANIAALSRDEQIPIYSDLPTLEKQVKFDGAIVTVPHHLHQSYTTELLRTDKFVIKEKPISLNENELVEYEKNDAHGTPKLFTVVQRQFQDSFMHAKKDMNSIGPVYAFKYEYCLGLKDETSGWRARRITSGGGVLLDAGYHIVDILHTFFGKPTHSTSQLACTLATQKEKLEDTAILLLSYQQGIKGAAIISRYGPLKKEAFEILGEHGALVITPTEYTIYDRKGSVIKKYTSTRNKDDETVSMFLTYLSHVNDNNYIKQELQRHKDNMKLIDTAYATITQ